MSSILRTVARRILTAAARLSSPGTRPWADAMLAELDAIEGDWTAFRWAVSGAGALLRRAIRETRISRRALIVTAAVAALIAIRLHRGAISETRPVPGQLGTDMVPPPLQIRQVSR